MFEPEDPLSVRDKVKEHVALWVIQMERSVDTYMDGMMASDHKWISHCNASEDGVVMREMMVAQYRDNVAKMLYSERMKIRELLASLRNRR
jgi:hypothetical protein